jgi:hypothetical protein
MFTSIIVPNTEQKRRFLARIVAFSLLEGLFRFLSSTDSLKIS